MKCDRVLRNALEERNRRRFVVVGAGTASAGLLAVTALMVLSATAPGEPAPTAAQARAEVHSAHRAAAPVPGEAGAAPDAVAFLKLKDPRERVVRHVRQVSQSGSYLRVYTDLREGDENSPPAISLCEWTAQYLRGLGADRPIVFVHARRNDNGHVVLANKQSANDDCTVGTAR